MAVLQMSIYYWNASFFSLISLKSTAISPKSRPVMRAPAKSAANPKKTWKLPLGCKSLHVKYNRAWYIAMRY